MIDLLSKSSLRAIDTVGVAACLGLTALAFLLSVQPTLERKTELRQTRAQLVAEKARASKADELHSALQQQIRAIEKAVEESSLDLLPRRELNARLAIITSAAQRHDVAIDTLEPGAPAAHPHFVTVPVTVAGRGSYTDLTGLLHHLHTIAPDTAVAGLDLQGRSSPGAAAGSPAQGGATFRLELIWHAAPDPFAHATTEQPASPGR